MGAPRYPSGPRPGVRMPQGIGNDFNGVSFIYNYFNFFFYKFITTLPVFLAKQQQSATLKTPRY